MGLDSSLNDAFKEATSDMASWLDEDYKLTPSEIAQVLGTAAEYHVSEVADRNAGMVLKNQQSPSRHACEIGDGNLNWDSIT
jgi:acetamidase/formamidase